MEMNLQKVRMRKKCTEQRIQLTLDDDFNVPDQKMDIGTIVTQDGRIEIVETNLVNGKLLIKGRLHFNMLYKSAEEKNLLQSIQGKIEFDEMQHMEETQEGQKEEIKWELEDISISLINSRKVSVKALVNLRCSTWQEYEENIPSGVENRGQIPCKYKELCLAEYVQGKKDILRLKENVRLPAAKPNVDQILYYDLQPQGLEVQLQNGQILLRGELNLFVIYRALEDGTVHLFQTEQAVQGNVTGVDCREDSILQLYTDVASRDLQVKQDEDGEERMLEAELVLGCEMHVYEKRGVPGLIDAYARNQKLELEKEQIAYRSVVFSGNVEKRMAEQVVLEENIGETVKICHSRGKVLLEGVQWEDSTCTIHGNIEITTLYMDATSDCMKEWVVLLPFTQNFVCDVEETSHVTYEVYPAVGKTVVSVVGKNTVEVKTSVNLRVLVFENRVCEIIRNIKECPYEAGWLEHMPDMVGYTVKKGDTLWKIAKQFLTTEEEILALNQKKGSEIQPGEKLLVATAPK